MANPDYDYGTSVRFEMARQYRLGIAAAASCEGQDWDTVSPMFEAGWILWRRELQEIAHERSNALLIDAGHEPMGVLKLQ